MSAFVGRLLVLFYLISIPIFLGLYVASGVSAHPNFHALWFDGGITELGSAAFWVLLAIYVFPLCLTLLHHLLSDAESYVKKVLVISLWMSPWPVGSAIFANIEHAKFPMAIAMIRDDGIIFWALVCAGGVAYSVYGMHETLSRQEAERKKVEALAGRFGVSQVDVADVMERLGVMKGKVSYYTGTQNHDQYVMLHLRLFSICRSSVDDYWNFVGKAIGGHNFFRDKALVELERHVRLSLEFGGMENYFHWLEELRRFKLCDKSFEYYFSGTYGHEEVSLTQVLSDYRIGEFTNATEYLEFLKARPPSYVSSAEREKYQADADKMTHPVLLRMLELGGFYRARALQIAQRSFSRDLPVIMAAPASLASAAVVSNPSDARPSAQPGFVMISRGGKIIFKDLKIQNLSNMVMQGHVLITDYYWHSGMAAWSLVSTYGGQQVQISTPREGVNWSEVLKGFFLSWILYVLGGTLVAGLIGYGRGGVSGVGSAIGGYLGFIIMVRPVSFLLRTIFRLIIGKRGMELFR